MKNITIKYYFIYVLSSLMNFCIMIKKIILYNCLTVFFACIHIVSNLIFFEKDFFLLKIYIFLLPVSSFFFYFSLFTITKKANIAVSIYIGVIIKLFLSIYVFFYFILEYLNLFKNLLDFVFSYFMILFFRTFFLMKKMN